MLDADLLLWAILLILGNILAKQGISFADLCCGARGQSLGGAYRCRQFLAEGRHRASWPLAHNKAGQAHPR